MPRKSRAKALVPNNTHNIFVMLAGFFGGVIGDALYNTQRLPGFDNPTGIPAIKWADFGQLVLYFFLLFLALINQRRDLGNFAYGLIVGKSMSTVLLPAVGLPRYIFYDVDASGNLVPVSKGIGEWIGGLPIVKNQQLLNEFVKSNQA